MRKRLITRMGTVGLGALVVLALTAPPAYGLARPAEPVPPAGLTGVERRDTGCTCRPVSWEWM